MSLIEQPPALRPGCPPAGGDTLRSSLRPPPDWPAVGRPQHPPATHTQTASGSGTSDTTLKPAPGWSGEQTGKGNGEYVKLTILIDVNKQAMLLSLLLPHSVQKFQETFAKFLDEILQLRFYKHLGDLGNFPDFCNPTPLYYNTSR